MEFVGSAQPLTPAGLAESTDRLAVNPAVLWTVLAVETVGTGFLPDKRPTLLFERHVFHRETEGRFDAVAPDVSRATAGGYGAAGTHQYDRLRHALELDARAALRSASWGIGQVMGFNAELVGFPNVDAMVQAMTRSEDEQLRAMTEEVVSSRLHLHLQALDWAGFSRGYNGPDFARNHYDTRLSAAYRMYSAGALPDLTVRAVQLYLTYCGAATGVIDGILGPRTKSAISAFRVSEGLPPSDEVDDELIARLRERAA